MVPPAFSCPTPVSFFSSKPPSSRHKPTTCSAAPPSKAVSTPSLRALLPPSAASVLATGASAPAQLDLVDALLSAPGAQNADVVCVGWLRHYGCTLCLRQAKDWEKELKPRLADAPGVARLVLVGCGSVEQADVFREDAGWTGDIYTDPERATYGALGFAQGAGSVFNLPALGKTIQSFWQGNRQRWLMKPTDPLLQGGALVIDRAQGTVELLHRDKFAGDHAPIDILFEAAKEICPS